jgi:hypothetical protein
MIRPDQGLVIDRGDLDTGPGYPDFGQTPCRSCLEPWASCASSRDEVLFIYLHRGVVVRGLYSARTISVLVTVEKPSRQG